VRTGLLSGWAIRSTSLCQLSVTPRAGDRRADGLAAVCAMSHIHSVLEHADRGGRFWCVTGVTGAAGAQRRGPGIGHPLVGHGTIVTMAAGARPLTLKANQRDWFLREELMGIFRWNHSNPCGSALPRGIVTARWCRTR
jgi:hypothetical protein